MNERGSQHKERIKQRAENKNTGKKYDHVLLKQVQRRERLTHFYSQPTSPWVLMPLLITASKTENKMDSC